MGLIKKTTKFRTTDKFPRKRKLWIGVGIIFILVLTPFAFYLYRFAPADSNIWTTPFFIIESNGFRTVQGFVHALITKITFFISFSIWFLTCRHWWKYAILVPLTMFTFQLLGVLNQEWTVIDEYDFWYSLPIIIPILGFLVWFSRKLNFYTTALDINEQINNEIESIEKPTTSP